MDLEKILTNGSPLVVLVIVVWLFLQFIYKVWKEMQELLKQFHGEHILARKETKDSVDANTKAMMENTAAVQKLAASVRNGPFKPQPEH